MRLSRTALTSLVTLALLVPAGATSARAAEAPSGVTSTTSHERGERARSAPSRGTQVLAVSVDGLNPDAIRTLGRDGAPTFHRLVKQGAATLNARTAFEQTVTLPNHAGMLTGRRITADRGGHGVTWDDDRPRTTVQKAAGHKVASIFNAVHADGGRTALFATKTKFGLYERSWPTAIDRFRVDGDTPTLVRAARRDLVRSDRAFTFLHLSPPDLAGHGYGGMSAEYLDAVRQCDRLLGTVLQAVDRHPGLARDLVVVLTADHGFPPGLRDHSAKKNVGNYRIPFLVWGAGVAHDDLYDLNPDYRDPGARRPSYARERQPVRNADVANVAAHLLGLDPVRGSEFGRSRTLDVRR
jgi:hypothetical protein